MSTVVDLPVIGGLAPIDLAELESRAALQHRTDRKYVIETSQLDAALASLVDARALEIDGRRWFAYRSVYFDTPSFELHRAAACRRPRRVKVRTRTYVDTGRCVLEVKRRHRDGRTEKLRTDHSPERAFDVSDAGTFLDTVHCLRGISRALTPALTTEYERSSLLTADGARVTIDRSVECRTPDGRSALLAGRVVLETKTHTGVSEVDRMLWRLGFRPIPISKYGTTLGALRPELPSNAWRRTIDRHVQVR